MAVKHSFVSGIPDGADATLVRPSNWNADHTIDAGTITKAMIENVANSRVLGRNTAGSGTAEEVTASQLLDWVTNTNGVLLTRAAGTWGAVTNVSVDAGNLVNATISTPTAPSAGVKDFAQTFAGRALPAWIDSAGLVAPYAPHIARLPFARWIPQPGGATTNINADGIGCTVTGTSQVHTPVASGNYWAYQRRVGANSAASGTGVAGYRSAVAFVARGAATMGGFHLWMRFSVADASLVTTARTFAGLWSSGGAPTDVDPSTLTNLIGVGADASDTVLQLYASGSSAQARVSLGANFPMNTTSVDVFELQLYCAPGGSTVTYTVTRLNTGDVATGTISAGASLPSTTTMLAPQLWRSEGGTATQTRLDLHLMHLEILA